MPNNKRDVDELLLESSALNGRPSKQVKFDTNVKKHTLDSDEEDDEDQDRYNVLNENDIDGEEESSTNRQEGETNMMAFNMQEEMEMGHFDRDGHFIWKNEKEVRDNWLDNIDWQKVAPKKHQDQDQKARNDEQIDSDSDNDELNAASKFNVIESYKKIVAYLKPKESISKALRRLGGDLSKLSSVERLKRKKAGTLQPCTEVAELTELANEFLTREGNMDIYQETYEGIMQKLANHEKKCKSKANIVEAELDMYSDDFDKKEEEHLVEGGANVVAEEDTLNTVFWEFKWVNKDGEKVEGPFDSGQMNKWSREGYFKSGVWVRKCNVADVNFYSSKRIDFELYI